jgi:hypothetical protein
MCLKYSARGGVASLLTEREDAGTWENIKKGKYTKGQMEKKSQKKSAY